MVYNTVIQIKKYTISICLIWTVLLLVSFLMNYSDSKNERERLALASARNLFGMVSITRAWNAMHGGLYAPVTEQFQPNPYLEVRMRDIVVDDDLLLTKINPSFMTRQLSEIAEKENGVQFRITSIRPTRPQNRPTEREKRYLKLFEQDAVDKGEFILKNNRAYYFYMAPLVTSKSCLECHAKQGYIEGDIRGGISILLPFVMKVPVFSLIFWHSLFAGCGMMLICLASNRLGKAYERIQLHAIVDDLTKIPNRRSFNKTMEMEYKRCLRESFPMSLVMGDIDFFKAFNDTYGHNEGDKCLKNVAGAIKASLKRPLDSCARFGGEEFVIVLPATPLEGAVHMAEQVRSAVENLKIPHEHSLSCRVVTLSLGVAALDSKRMTSPEDLIKKADKALYKAKDNGRNQVQSG